MKFCPNCAYALNGNSAVVSEAKYTTQPQYIDPQQEYLQPNQQIYRGKKQPIMPLGDHVEQNFVYILLEQRNFVRHGHQEA